MSPESSPTPKYIGEIEIANVFFIKKSFKIFGTPAPNKLQR